MTTLEEMQKIGSGMSSIQAYSLVGKYAYAQSVDAESGETIYTHGNIDSIVNDSGTYYAIIGEDTVEVGDIVQIFDSSLLEASETQLTDLIGQTVTGTYDPGDGTTATITGVVTAITYGEDDVYAIVDGISISVDNIIAVGGQAADEASSGEAEDAGTEEGSDVGQTTET